MEWQPIETAPKDETEVLLYFPTEVIVMAFWSEEGEDWFEGEADSVSLTAFGRYPTHWMPLPDPPE